MLGQHSFQEVMKQYNRMFEAHKQGVSIPVEASYETAVKQPEYFEEVVMDWAANNPEPVYPTFAEWLHNIGVTFSDQPFPAPNIPVYVFQVNVKMFEPIHTDIAEKLGIQPKEG